ncbi:YycH family regulatory protein [Peribacillus kribbensis]|uniref:YycH family regulatory protein n=1 Tax=Peribacillus kribbensis TaxID=356658 RepID=UPI0003FBFA6D|nr:two-component system activity regulator YycH [Peribacillus kribbensis]
MRRELYKSIILTVLVLVSVGLTFSIWAYQPEYQKAVDPSEYIQVSIKNKQNIGSIVKPMEVMYHKNNQHFVTTSDTEINKVMKEITHWSFYSFSDISNRISDKEFLSFVHGEGKTEIIFPETVPLHLYNSVLAMNNKTLPKGEFDRIIINVNNMGERETSVYFVSYDKKKIYQSKVSTSFVESFRQKFYRFSSALYEDKVYKKYVISHNHAVFMPETPKLPRYSYKISKIDTKQFQDALFSDPNSIYPRGDEITDGQSLLNIYKDTMTLSYISPPNENQFIGSTSELLRKSIAFVNDHAGWEDKYRYAGYNELDQKITFRLFEDGLPVFNDSGMSEIVQYWGKNDVYQYNRPFFTLDFQIPYDEDPVKLPGGKEVLQELYTIKNIKNELIQDIKLGYELKREDQEMLVTLEPEWYYRYAGVWKRVPFGKPGGDTIGLE